MTITQKIRLSASVILIIPGLFFLYVSSWAAISLIFSIDTFDSHEFNLIAWLSACYSFVCCLISSFLTISVKNTISKRLFWILNIPSLLSGSLLIILLTYSLVMWYAL